MPSLESAVFLFTMRQVVVFTSWLVVPPAVRASDTSGWEWGDAFRYAVDGKLASVVYVLTSLVSYGVTVGLFQRPLDPMGHTVVTAAVKAMVYFGVAVVRIFPLLNGNHVSLTAMLRCLGMSYPLLAIVLGALSIEPCDMVGRLIRKQWGVSFWSVVAINAVNVISMLWSNAAGRFLAELILVTYVHVVPA
jgi:hypothetical protein